MATSTIDTGIATLYEEGATVEELKQLFPDLELDAIKMSLMQNSALYRKRIKDNNEVFSNDTFQRALQVIESQLESIDNQNLAHRAAKLVIYQRMGLLDKKGMKSLNVNIQTINQQIIQAAEIEKRAKERIVDIDPKHAHLKEIAA
jgi:hypothetical protein